MTLTIEITDADAKRICRAFGTAETPATEADLELTCKHWLNNSTVNWEQSQVAAKRDPRPLKLIS